MQIINQYQDGEYIITEWDNGVIESRLAEAPFVNVEDKKITKLAFKNRFPRSKWIAARSASNADANLADFFESFDLATFIGLEDEETVYAVNSFASEGIPVEMKLTQQEVESILSGVILENERLA